MRNVRVGVTLYPAYVEECMLQETNLLKLKCKDPGLSVKALQVLQYALRNDFTFKLFPLDDSINGSFNTIKYAFNTDVVDMSVDLWTFSHDRAKLVDFSYPLIFKRLSYLTSIQNLKVHSVSFSLLPLHASLLACILGVATLLSLLSLSNLVRSRALTGLGRKEMFKTLLRHLLRSQWNFFVVLVRQSANRKIFSFLGGSAVLISWMLMGAFIYAHYSGFMTTELISQADFPFRDGLEMAGKIKAGLYRMINSDPEAIVFTMARTSGLPLFRALNKSFEANPPLIVKSSSLKAILSSEPRFIYESNTVVSKFMIGRKAGQFWNDGGELTYDSKCEFIEVVERNSELSGLALIFPLGSDLPPLFNPYILRLFNGDLMVRILNEPGDGDNCVDLPVEVKAIPLGHMTLLFTILAVGLGLGFMFLLGEANKLRSLARSLSLDNSYYEFWSDWGDDDDSSNTDSTIIPEFDAFWY